MLLITMGTSVTRSSVTRSSVTRTMMRLVLSSVVSLVASEAAASGSNGSSAGGLDMLPFPEGKKEKEKRIHGVLGLILRSFS